MVRLRHVLGYKWNMRPVGACARRRGNFVLGCKWSMRQEMAADVLGCPASRRDFFMQRICAKPLDRYPMGVYNTGATRVVGLRKGDTLPGRFALGRYDSGNPRPTPLGGRLRLQGGGGGDACRLSKLVATPPPWGPLRRQGPPQPRRRGHASCHGAIHSPPGC